MKVAIAYLTVIMVWSTTPLGLAWSSESVHPSMAGFLRMVIALVLGAVILLVWRIKLPLHSAALKLYAYSSVGLFGGMFSSYLAAAYISTGMMSLAFGMSPIVTGIIAYKLLDEPKMSVSQLVAIAISVVGLAIVFSDTLNLAADAWKGILLISVGVLSFSYSAVLIKTVQITIHPASTMVGSMLIATPLYLMTWFIMDGTLPVETWSSRSLISIVYLGIFGSLIGFVCYFYILQKLTTANVSLITMMTPVFAILLGNGLNNEVITIHVLLGASAIIVGLALYQQQNIRTKKQQRMVSTAAEKLAEHPELR